MARTESDDITETTTAFGDRGGFLTTHRAQAACTREFARLAEELVKGVGAFHAEGIEDKPVIRHSPGRCIVQLGPVAATMTWLRSTRDAVTEGELLVAVWRGSVMPSNHYAPERTLARQAPAPVAAKTVWEEVFFAEAESEDSWTWVSRDPTSRKTVSHALAELCVSRLREAYTQG